MEIGYPTDVKHVAHIGWDGPSGSAPSWMNEFNVASDFAATSIGNMTGTRGTSSAISTWSSQDFESMDQQPVSEMLKDITPNIPKKHKRKKNKSTSSPKSSSSSRSSRAAKSKAKYVEDNARPSNLEVM